MNAQHWPCTIEEYHASDGVSNSRITDFQKDPGLYDAKYVSRWWKDSQTKSQSVGSLVHDMMLTDDFLETICIIPEDIPIKRGKAWDAWSAEHEGFVQLKQDEFDLANRYCTAIRRNPTAMRVIEESKHEYSIRWNDDETGLLCRCRHDIFHPRLDADIKTTQSNSAEAFAKSVFKWGYHRQRAHYGEGSMRIRNGEVVPFWFFAVTPFSCKIYQLSEEFEQQGQKEVRKALDGIKRCMDSGYWGDGTEAKPVELPMPRYVHSLEDYEVEEV